eukprot:260195_1
MALDETLMNRNMMNAMNVARNAMHIENPDLLMDEVQQTQEDIQEALDLQQEFNDLMGTSFVQYDEDELEAELNELDDDMMDDGLLYNSQNRKINKKMKIEQKEDKEDEEEEEEEEED